MLLDQRHTIDMDLRLRPAPDPVIFMITKQSIIDCDTSFALKKLQTISADPSKAHEFVGRLVLVFDGYYKDKRELWAIPEVRTYVQKLDREWPYWYFFLNQASESIQILESCLVDVEEVAPGVASIDAGGLERSMARHFGYLENYAAAVNYPEDKALLIQEGIIQIIGNAAIDPDEVP